MDNIKKKAIILTLPLGNNYGGILQAYALQKVVSDMGVDVVTDKNASKNKNWKKYFLWLYLPIRDKLLEFQGRNDLTRKAKQVRLKKIEKFIDDNIKTVDFFKGNNTPSRRSIRQYDLYIVGSDQVWRKEYVNIQSYFLSFLDKDNTKLKISYAASLGKDNIAEWSKDDINVAKLLLPQFDAISVREKSAVEILKRDLQVEAIQVLDPTMLLKKSDYLKLDDITNIQKRKNVLFCYIIDMTDQKKEMIKRVKELRGLKEVLLISPKIQHPEKGKIEDNIYPSVGEWLSGFRDADFVLTDSYHGTIFSIIFNKPFLSIGNMNRGLSRFESLLKPFKLETRIVNPEDEVEDIVLKELDYEYTGKVLDEMRTHSIDFLEKNIKG